MPTTVPTAFRQIDPSIPPDRQINDPIAAINIPEEVGVPAKERVIAAVLRIGQMAGRGGGWITVPISLDNPEQDQEFPQKQSGL